MPDYSATSNSSASPNSVGKSKFARYTVAIAAVVLAFGVRQALVPLWGTGELPFIFFYPAVVLAAWYGRRGPGGLAIILSAAAADWFLIEPRYSFAVQNASELIALISFTIVNCFLVAAVELMHRSNDRVGSELAQRLKAEAQLAAEKELLATTLASIGDAVIVTDPNGKVISLNAEAERLTAWSNAEASGKALADVFKIVNEETQQPAENPVEKVLRLGTVTGLANHTVLISTGAREIPIDDSAAPIRHANGSILGVVLIFRDVTEQRRAEQEHARLAEIVKYSGDAIFTKDFNGTINSWNASAQRLFGYAPEEIIGKPVTRLFPPDRLHEEDYILGCLRLGQPSERLETIRVTKDGRRINVSVSVSPLKNSDGEIIGASTVIHDVTDLIAAREALTREKELLATTLASIGDAVIVTDADGRVTFLNHEAEHLTGWRSGEASGLPLNEVFQIINEQTRERVENPVEKVIRLGGVVGLANHTILVAKDGRELPIDDSAAPIQLSGEPLFGIVLVFRDFSQRKQTEETLRNAQQTLRALFDREHELRELAEEANRLKDEFLAIMSHELRNPLNVILGYSELLVRSEEIMASPELQRMAEAIKRNATAQSKLIRDLLDLSRLRSGKLDLNREPVSIAAAVHNAIETVRAEAEAKQIAIEIIPPDEPSFVDADPVRLEQIIWNLLNNSIKFTPAGGRISVRASQENERVFLAIEDTGQGIDASFLPHVFEMFRQADGGASRARSGMGIGLAVVQQLVELHGGWIGASSAGRGKGATFTIKLPVSLQTSIQAAPVVDLRTRLDEMAVLVVDDSEDTTEMLAHLLKMSGAVVTSATSGAEALRIVSEKEFDLILSDISMPGMDGFEFLQRLRQLRGREEVPVLALTGFGRPEDVERAEIEGFFSHVTKPFELEVLLGVLQKLPKKRDGNGRGRSLS